MGEPCSSRIEKFGMRPHVGAVVRDIDWNVAHEADAALLTVALEVSHCRKNSNCQYLKACQFGSEFFRPLDAWLGRRAGESPDPMKSRSLHGARLCRP